MSVGQFVGYWREGDRLVMDRNAVLPDRCVRCDQPAEGYRRTVKVSYAPGSARLLFGEIALLWTKRATVAVGLCERHRPRRGRAITPALIALAGVFGLLAIPSFVTAIPAGLGAGVILGFVAIFVVAAFVALARAFGGGSVRATKITDSHVWLKGAGTPFLESLAAPPPAAEGGALPVLPGTPAPEPAAAAAAAFSTARNGAIAFAAGAVITAATYLTSTSGRYTIVWGLVIFGLIAFLRGANEYRRVPAVDRTRNQVVTLGGILAIGLLAAGAVVTNEVQAYGHNATLAQWNAALERVDVPDGKAAQLFDQIAARRGPWTAQSSADMTQIGAYFSEAADILTSAPVTSDWAWYKDGLVKAYRESADIATQFSVLTESSSPAALQALASRYVALGKEFDQLRARVDAQNAALKH
jgi:hypothetical protein